MKALFDLQTCVQDIADAPQDQKDTKKLACSTTAKQALLVAGQLEQQLPADPEGKVDQRVSALLEAPIKPYSNFTVVTGGPGGLCDPLRKLLTAYPFAAHGTRDMTLDEFNGVFQPATGALSKFIADHKDSVTSQSGTLVRALESKAVGPVFLRMLNALYVIQLAVYPNNAKDPHFEYQVTTRVPEVGGFKTGSLSFDGQTWTITDKPGTKKFTWPGPIASGASLSLNSGGADIDLPGAQGLWAVAHFLSPYNWQSSGNVYTIQGPLMGPGGPMTSAGKTIEVRFDVDFKGAPFFHAGYMSNYGCPARMNQ
jgi:type VI protein secretion system component VasK